MKGFFIIFGISVAIIIYLVISNYIKLKKKKKEQKIIEDMIYKIVPVEYPDIERKMILEMHNAMRKEYNQDLIRINLALPKEDRMDMKELRLCKPLKTDSFTTHLAFKRNNEMIRVEKLSHKEAADEFGMLLKLGADTVGENIAYGQGTILGLMNMWHKSEGHYQNIINYEYDWCGIAISKDDKRRNWYCVIFGNENDIIQ